MNQSDNKANVVVKYWPKRRIPKRPGTHTHTYTYTHTHTYTYTHTHIHNVFEFKKCISKDKDIRRLPELQCTHTHTHTHTYTMYLNLRSVFPRTKIFVDYQNYNE